MSTVSTGSLASSALKSILIVEDVDEMRHILSEVVASLPGVKLSGSAGNLWDARLELDRRRPDLVLLDELMGSESTLDFYGELKSQEIQVIWLTSLQEEREVPVGALGRLRKPDLAEEGRRQGGVGQTLENFIQELQEILPKVHS